MDRGRSQELFARARKLLPGGVSSPVRAFGAVGGDPVFMARGEGAWIQDVDGNRYIDYVMSWGPLALGHADRRVVDAIQHAVVLGTSFGAPTELELELAGLINRTMPSMEMLRFVSSGTEATMSAIRLARAFTGRTKLLKFAGCYHGHADSLLVQAGSGVATLGLPDSPGVPPATAADTLVAPYNDPDTVEQIAGNFKSDLAAIIVEPVAGNMGVVPPAPGFLERLREIADATGALLIFDEVMTGYRVHRGGAQALVDVRPDLTTLGKIVGGGFPVGAYGGRADIMSLIAPSGSVYQAGTLSGNPVAMAAGIATLNALLAPGAWEAAESAAARLESELASLAARSRKEGPIRVQRCGTMLTTFFSDSPVTDWESARRCDTARFARFFRTLLQKGVYWPPSQFEAAFVSTAHGDAELDYTSRALIVALES